MPSPQLRRLTELHRFPLLDEHNVSHFCSEHDLVVLFFAGDPGKYPEANDVAMILPELLKSFQGLAAGLIAPAAEQSLQRHFGFARWPSLVFLRNRQVLGIISEMQNWEDYLHQIQQLLSASSSRIATVTMQ